MSRILILSATTGYQLRAFGDAAARLGFELMFATDRCHRLDDPWRDRAVAVRFHDVTAAVRAVTAACRKTPVDGLVAVGDRPVVLAAHVAEALQLPWNPPGGAVAAVNKRRTRERLRDAGLPVPWFAEIPDGSDAAAIEQLLRFPAVLKPLGLSASRGVIRVDDLPSADAALRRIRALLARRELRALRTGMERQILAEGYIDGPEYAIEGVLTEGTLHAFTIFDKPDRLEGPFFEETVYLTPSRLPAAVQAQVLEAVQSAALALGLRHGPVHAECRVSSGTAFVLEIAPRPIGGLCARVLRFAPGGRSLEDVLLRHAAGEDVAGVRLSDSAAGVMMIPIPRRGLLKRVEGEADARDVPGIEDVRITAKRDQLLEPLPESGSYLGFIFARGESTSAVDAALREAHRRLRFIIDVPIAVSG